MKSDSLKIASHRGSSGAGLATSEERRLANGDGTSSRADPGRAAVIGFLEPLPSSSRVYPPARDLPRLDNRVLPCFYLPDIEKQHCLVRCGRTGGGLGRNSDTATEPGGPRQARAVEREPGRTGQGEGLWNAD